MQKPADTNFPIHDLIRDRWSSVSFSDRPVETEKIGSLLEAARWAPSSYNAQPWTFFVAAKSDPDEYERLLSCLLAGNQAWAKNAPLLMLAVAAMNFEGRQKANPHAFHDVGMASENLTIQATALGLFVHQMAGFDADQARNVYAIPTTYDPVACLAIGYHAPLTNLDASLQSRDNAARSRKPFEDFVFAGKWGQSYQIDDA